MEGREVRHSETRKRERERERERKGADINLIKRASHNFYTLREISEILEMQNLALAQTVEFLSWRS